MTENRPSDFERAALESGNPTIFSDFWHFLRHSRKWWLLPLICALVMLSGLMMLSGTAVAPFIYTLF